METYKTILIVDNSPAFATAVVNMLNGAYVAHIAYSAREAIQVAEKVRPHVIFLDNVLPDGEGYDVCSSLKQAFLHQPIQIILMLASYDARHMEKILQAGADDFIKKPFEGLEFQLRLKAAFIRLHAQIKLMEEREFYRQAVRQEENLTIKLLDRQLVLKETLADLESTKVGLEHENTKLAAAARFDLLTGLLNRHSLNARLELEMRRAEEEGLQLCGMMIDIDKFKSINDSFGHLVGDDVLRAIGDALRACLRKQDFAGRFGGEEFFVILPGSGVEAAVAIAERIKLTIAGADVDVAGAKVSVTASVGVAPYVRGDTMTDWIGRADKAMYRAKQLGRNRVEL